MTTYAHLACVVALDGDGLRDAARGQARLPDTTAWRGSALTGVGRQMVVDAAAGAAPQTVTLIDINARADVAGDAERRARIFDRRVANVRTELHRNGIAPVAIGEWPGPAPGGVQTYPPGELQAKQMVVIAHY